jgi:apolipoprotein N-acyltransferase
MVQIDIPVAFALGGLHADAARAQLATGKSEHLWRTLARDLLFFGVFASWLPLQLLVRHFGFETSHMWWHEDSVLAYTLFIPAFMTLYFASNVAGLAAGVALVRAGRVTLNRFVIAACLLFATGWVFLQKERTLVLGTYREWRAGTAPPISSDPGLVRLLVIFGIVFTVALVFWYRRIRREGAASQS